MSYYTIIIIYSLDPDVDPLCVLLMLDFYALRSDEYLYLTQLYELWNSTRNLRILPNFALSVPLAMFHTSQPDSSERRNADLMVSHLCDDRLLIGEGVLGPINSKCNLRRCAMKHNLHCAFVHSTVTCACCI